MPKRSAERRRRNLVPGETRVRLEGEVRPPGLPRGTHPIARRWYASLRESGQSVFYEPSDWAAAVFVADTMTRLINARRFSAPLFASIWSAMEDLMTTEQSRRRARLEVERGEPAEGGNAPTAIDDYRKVLGL